jgi:hypothetical protein
MDIFASRVAQVLDDVAPVVSDLSQQIDFTVCPWIYPAGLSLHHDGAPKLAGSYTYFVHNHWNLHWGGQLLILDPRTIHAPPLPPSAPRRSTWIVDDVENDRVWDPALALCIFPKPNRIVFIREGVQHLVTRVDSAAGQNARLSIAGFFRKKDAAHPVLNTY